LSITRVQIFENIYTRIHFYSSTRTHTVLEFFESIRSGVYSKVDNSTPSLVLTATFMKTLLINHQLLIVLRGS